MSGQSFNEKREQLDSKPIAKPGPTACANDGSERNATSDLDFVVTPDHVLENSPILSSDESKTLGAPSGLTDSLQASDMVGRHQVVAEIASGGMGIVLEGRDTVLGRNVAVKVLVAERRDDIACQHRFVTEARITARLQHPGIVPVYEMGHDHNTRPYYVMSRVKGQTLEELFAARESLQDLPRFLKIFDQMCQAIAYAHSEGVVHRDLKPSNIMVAPFGVVQVIDWGIAKELNTIEFSDDCVPTSTSKPALGSSDLSALPETNDSLELTQVGRFSGTPAYTSPEQMRRDEEHVDTRADVFGLGAILCEILTGQPPYVGDEDEVFLRSLAGDLADGLARLERCGADSELISLARNCLAAESAHRLPDAGFVARELAGYFESTMKRAERDLVRFFDLSLDLFCIAGMDGYFRRVNSNFSRVLGHSIEELVSRPFLDFVHADDIENTQTEVEKLLRGLPTIQFRNRYRDVNGGYRWFEWTAKSVPEDKVIFAVARDITDRLHFEPVVGNTASATAKLDFQPRT